MLVELFLFLYVCFFLISVIIFIFETQSIGRACITLRATRRVGEDEATENWSRLVAWHSKKSGSISKILIVIVVPPLSTHHGLLHLADAAVTCQIQYSRFYFADAGTELSCWAKMVSGFIPNSYAVCYFTQWMAAICHIHSHSKFYWQIWANIFIMLECLLKLVLYYLDTLSFHRPVEVLTEIETILFSIRLPTFFSIGLERNSFVYTIHSQPDGMTFHWCCRNCVNKYSLFTAFHWMAKKKQSIRFE